MSITALTIVTMMKGSTKSSKIVSAIIVVSFDNFGFLLDYLFDASFFICGILLFLSFLAVGRKD